MGMTLNGLANEAQMDVTPSPGGSWFDSSR